MWVHFRNTYKNARETVSPGNALHWGTDEYIFKTNLDLCQIAFSLSFSRASTCSPNVFVTHYQLYCVSYYLLSHLSDFYFGRLHWSSHIVYMVIGCWQPGSTQLLETLFCKTGENAKLMEFLKTIFLPSVRILKTSMGLARQNPE